MGWPVGLPVSTIQTLLKYGTYEWFMLNVGLYMGYGADADSWNTEQLSLSDLCVQRGALQFWSPPIAGQDGMPHIWSFLQLVNAFSLTQSTTAYDMDAAAGFVSPTGYILGVTFSGGASPGQGRRIELISDHAMRSVRGAIVTALDTGPPQYVAIRPKAMPTTAEQLWELTFYPNPDAANTLLVRYASHPVILSKTNTTPPGTLIHAETLLCSMLSIAESLQTKTNGPMHERYLQRLAAAVAYDRAVSRTETDRVNPVPANITTKA